MKALRLVCFTICILCILAAVVLSLFLIWGSGEPNILWRSVASLGVFFLASLLTMGVVSMVEPKLEASKKGQ